MASVTIIGKIRKRTLQFEYNGVWFGARRITEGWLMFAEGEFIGTCKCYPFQFAYDWLTKQ